MDYVRKIANSDILSAIIDIPENLRNRKVEILVIPYEHEKNEGIIIAESKKDTRGILKRYSKKGLRAIEEGAWIEAVAEKYEDS